jgi:hypothetical protein
MCHRGDGSCQWPTDAFALGQPGRAIIDLLTRNSRQFKSVEDCFRTDVALRHYEAGANVSIQEFDGMGFSGSTMSLLRYEAKRCDLVDGIRNDKLS